MRRVDVQASDAPTGAQTARAAEIERFCATEAPRVLGALTLITGDRAAAEDALQDALVTAWRRPDPIDRLGAWVTVVASNAARSGRRRRGAEERAMQRAAVRRESAAAQTDPSNADDDLQRALQGLPLRERQAAVLHYVLDQSVADTATSMQVSEGTVKTLLSRARAHLAQQLGLEREGGVA